VFAALFTYTSYALNKTAGLVSETLSTGMGYTRVGVEPASTFIRFNSPLLSDKLDGTAKDRHILCSLHITHAAY
jgi:hypothetical protein